jgi:hypothetical protein
MGTERQDPTRPAPTSPDGDRGRQDAQRDRRPGQSSDRPEEKRRNPTEINPEVPGDDDDLDQPGQSGNQDRERSGSTRTRTP